MSSSQRISSNRAFILAIAGAAIGLGNIWRFPYIAGENGGGLFFLIYLLFVVVMGLPVMIAEISLGRAGRASPASSLRQLAVASGHSRHWAKVAGLGTLAATLVLSFYSVVSGWALFYFFQSVSNSLATLSTAQAGGMFEQFLASPLQVIGFHTLFIIMTILVSGSKVSAGIEKLNTWLMPAMYLILLGLVVYASGFAGFPHAIDYLFAAKFEAINWSVMVEAMGHAFFTLAIGACCLMAYGAYMPEKQSIIKTVGIVALLDVLVAVMVGAASFSVVFTEGMEPTAGPGLMFIALPVALAKMPLGEWIMPLFFLLLIIATWTSSINLGEPLVVAASRWLGSRRYGALLTGIVVWLMGLIPSFSFNLLADIKPLPDKSLFDVYTAFPTQVLLPVTGLLTLIFAGYVLDSKRLSEQLGLSGIKLRCWLWLIRIVSPLLVAGVLVFGFL